MYAVLVGLPHSRFPQIADFFGPEPNPTDSAEHGATGSCTHCEAPFALKQYDIVMFYMPRSECSFRDARPQRHPVSAGPDRSILRRKVASIGYRISEVVTGAIG